MLIYKEELINGTGLQEIKLPFESAAEARSNILHLEKQADVPCMWFNVLDNELKEFMIVCIGTGHDWEDALKREEYIGSALVYDGALVWHYFLVEKEEFVSRMKNNFE